jgi:hypothetical protein
MDYVHGEIGRGDVASDLAKVVGLDDGQPLLLAVAPKEHCRDLAIWRIGLGLPHPFLRLDLLATLDLNVKWEIPTDHIPRTALWIASVLLCASGFLPALPRPCVLN